MHNPESSHWQAVKHILRYLQGTATYGLSFTKSSNLKLSAFYDADWGSDLDDRKSTTSYCVYLGSNLVSWSSKKQAVVSRSSTEAEYRSLDAVSAELAWLQYLLTELHIPLSSPPTIYCDNVSVVLLASNPILHSRTKHFELDLYFVRDKIQNKKLLVHHVPSAEQTADALTKVVPLSIFEACRYKLRVHESEPM